MTKIAIEEIWQGAQDKEDELGKVVVTTADLEAGDEGKKEGKGCACSKETVLRVYLFFYCVVGDNAAEEVEWDKIVIELANEYGVDPG